MILYSMELNSETECNTTDVIPSPGDEPLPVTFCQKWPRQICAPERCSVVEGPEKCVEQTVQSTAEQPTELWYANCKTVKS